MTLHTGQHGAILTPWVILTNVVLPFFSSSSKELLGSRHLVAKVLSQERVGTAVGQSGRAIMGSSASGEYVSVCWPAMRTFAVFYRTLAGTWQEVDVGIGVNLVWHSHQ
jgi:hypothetical protein